MVSTQRGQKRLTALPKFFFQSFRAVAVAARPRFAAVFVTAVFAIVRVLDAEQFEVFLPVRFLLLQWSGAVADFDPTNGLVRIKTRLLHIAKILISGD